MSISICITHEDGEFSQMQWDYILLNFKPDNLYIITPEDLELSHRSPRSKAKFIRSIEELPKDIPLIVTAPKTAEYYKGEISLNQFNHPESAIYFFGPDEGHIKPEYFEKRKPDSSIYIPVDTDDQMFCFTAYAVVMWDRRIRNG